MRSRPDVQLVCGAAALEYCDRAGSASGRVTKQPVVQAARSMLQYNIYLLARNAGKPFDKFVDSSAAFQVRKQSRDRYTSAPELSKSRTSSPGWHSTAGHVALYCA